jgi:tetratricopeptide (TPR) repeat protein
MRANVYTDKSLERYAGRFVWLSINTEDASSAAFLKRYPIPALPTLLILDAKRDNVALRYVGGANVTQVKTMLGDAEKTYRSRAGAEADRDLAEGDRFAAEGKQDQAVHAFEEAIRTAPSRWARLGRTAESLMFSLAMGDDQERCATRALELYPRVKGTVSAANVAATGVSCAAGLDKKNPKRADLVTALETATREVFDDPKIDLSGDDRSGLYMALIEARDAAGDDEAVAALTGQWSAFLEDAAAKAKTAEQRAVYDSHRLSAYLELGTPEKAIPMLEQSARDFPNDYNPQARLSVAYKAMKEYDKALAASDAALKLAYGPRKLVVLTNRADLLTAKGDLAGARATIADAIAFARSLPEGQRSDRRIASLEKRLAGMN